MSTQDWKNFTRILGTIGLAVVLTVLSAIGLRWFFATQGVSDPWVVAVSSSSSIVLVIVTTVYVVFTGHLVRLQSESNRHLIRQDSSTAVRNAMGYVVPAQLETTKLLAQFPLDTNNPNNDRNNLDYEGILKQSENFQAIALQLPTDLMKETFIAVTKMKRAVISCQTLNSVILHAQLKFARDKIKDLSDYSLRESDKRRKVSESESISWEQMRGLFYSDDSLRPGLADENGTLPEWSDVESGRFIQEARDSLGVLEGKYQQWLAR